MANRALFSSPSASHRTGSMPRTTARNEAGGRAYARDARHALAQYAATGCLNGTFYASAATQLDALARLAEAVDVEFVAKTALYARSEAHMKDVPAYLVASLAARDVTYMEWIFERVIDNGKMLRNFVQILRSGVTGRRSLGSAPKRCIRRWLESRSDAQLFADSVGNSPSLADILRMVHPKPHSASRRALYAWILAKPYDVDALPECVRQWEAFRALVEDRDALRRIGGDLSSMKVPTGIPMGMLMGLELDAEARAAVWRAIARDAKWMATRMNLSSFARHGVFEDRAMTRLVAQRLGDAEQVRKAKAFPYQLMNAYVNAAEAVPASVRDALHDAMEIAVENVPTLIDRKGQPLRVAVLVDVSGSMHSPVTGYRKGATTSVRCIDVAALVAASVLRRNPDAEVIAFHDRVEATGVPGRGGLEPRDSVFTNAKRLAALPSGGTNCAAPLVAINRRGAHFDLVIYVSDNQSWIDLRRSWNPGTAVMEAWTDFRLRNPSARMVCIDVQPYATQQAPDRADILNVGGFSDAVFDLIATFAADMEARAAELDEASASTGSGGASKKGRPSRRLPKWLRRLPSRRRSEVLAEMAEGIVIEPHAGRDSHPESHWVRTIESTEL